MKRKSSPPFQQFIIRSFGEALKAHKEFIDDHNTKVEALLICREKNDRFP